MRLVLLVVVALLCVPPAAAHACKCSQPSRAAALAHAKVAFVGTITAVHEDKKCNPKHPTWCTSTFTYDVDIERVVKGKVDNRSVVVSAGHGRGDCSIGSLGKRVTGTRWTFFSSSTQAPFFLRLCGGTRRA